MKLPTNVSAVQVNTDQAQVAVVMFTLHGHVEDGDLDECREYVNVAYDGNERGYDEFVMDDMQTLVYVMSL